MSDRPTGSDPSLPTVPGFTIEREIGRGGFGTVYLAQQPQFDRRVAIKIITTSGVDDTTSRRFDRECRALGALSGHPNIVAVFDSGITGDGQLYLVMHYLTGGSLAERIADEGRLGADDAAGIGAKLADAMASAHDSNVLHRDIKPENILFSRWGEPILVDFGIARIVGADATTSASITASVAYAPTEVLSGQPADARSDIYSLGATIHTMLAGSPAFMRDSDESITPVISRIAMSAPPDLRLQGVPAPLAAVIERSLEKEPDQRYQRAEEFAAALRAATDQPARPEPPRSAPPTAPIASLPAPVPAQTVAAPEIDARPDDSSARKISGPVAAMIGLAVLAAVALIGILLTTLGGDDESGGAQTATAAVSSTASVPAADVALGPDQFPVGYTSLEAAQELAGTSYLCMTEPDTTGLLDSAASRYDNPATGASMSAQVGVFAGATAARNFLDSLRATDQLCESWLEPVAAASTAWTAVAFQPDPQPNHGDESVQWSGTLSDDTNVTRSEFDILALRVDDRVGVIVRTGSGRTQAPLDIAATNLIDNFRP